jgi:hypothetical protein
VNDFTTWTATRTDRGRSAAHRGTALATGIAAKLTGGSPLAAFAGVPAYVTDQESHPPREGTAG